jgi:chromosome segregation ATPase
VSEALVLALLNMLVLSGLALITRQQGKTLSTAVQGVKTHVDMKANQSTPETVETNTIVKEVLKTLPTSMRGYEIALELATAQVSGPSQEIADLRKEQTARAEASRINQEQIGALNTKVSEMEQNQIKIGKQLEQAQAELTETRRELGEQRDLVTRLETQIADERREKEQVIKERDAALKKVEALERRVAELELQVSQLEQKLGIQHAADVPLPTPPAAVLDNARHTPPKGVPVFDPPLLDTTGKTQEATPK